MRMPRRVFGTVTAIVALAVGCAGSGDGSDGSDAVGRFVVRCELSHVAFDDPIVLPWQPGKSHQHQFFGNVAVDSSPAYGAAEGAPTSCEDPLDSASFWAPTLLDARGSRVEPLGLTATFAAGRGVDPSDVVAFPPGLMLLGGDAAGVGPQPTDVVAWTCGPTGEPMSAPPTCGADEVLTMSVTFPDCWDDNRLTGFGSSAHARYSDDGCPDTHPVAVPSLTIGIDYPPIDTEGVGLSSGGIDTAHADFWNVWVQDKLEAEVAECINANVDCDPAL